MSHYTTLYKYGKRLRDFWGRFYFYLRDDYSQLGATRLVGNLSSHIQRALLE